MPPPTSSFSWITLVGVTWLLTINGANTDFPVYSSELKELTGISQVEINLLAFASDVGKFVGFIPGVAARYLPLWAVAVVGVACEFVGYLLQYCLLGEPRFGFLHIFLLTALAGNGICWINTACYLVIIENFAAADARIAVVLSTSYASLSAKFYTAAAGLIGVIFGDDHTRRAYHVYNLLNAVVPCIVAVIAVRFLCLTPGREKPRLSRRGFITFFAITMATGVTALADSVWPGSAAKVPLNTIFLLLLLSLVGIPVAMKLREVLDENRVGDLVDVEARDEEAEGHVEEKEGGDEESQDVGSLQMLKMFNFWLYFFSYMFSATVGMVFLNNLGQIAESRGLDSVDVLSLVSLSSSFGFLGRLLPLPLDYFSLKRNCPISRAALMATLMAPMAGAFFLLLHQSSWSLYLSTLFIGAFTGAITSFAVSATTELFGKKCFGVNHNIVVTNIPIGSGVFGYLAAHLYELQGRVSGGSAGGCVGFACYETTFLIWGVLCSTGCLLCSILYLRTR